MKNFLKIATPLGACAALAISTACGRAAVADVPAASNTSGDVIFETSSPKLAYVDVETVRVSNERTIAMMPAQVVLDEDHTVRVYSPVSGRIRELLVRPGDVVAKGAPLARIVSADFAQATSDLVKAQSAGAQASAARTRAEDLFVHHVIALRDLEQARNDALQSHAEEERAKQRVGLLGGGDGVQGEYVLRAPIGGAVLERLANAGAEVRPDATAPLFTISSLETLWLVAQAPQRDLAMLRRGAHLAFTTDAAPGRVFDARVSYVSDQLDPSTRTAVVRATLDNHDHALRAMVVGVGHLFAPDSMAHVTIATRALVTRGEETIVFVEKARGHFERRVVVVGDDDGMTVTIRAGLEPGERVVTRGSILLGAEAERLP